MFALKLTPRAEADLVRIWLYTFDMWGAEQADGYVDQIEESLKHLLIHPSLGADYSHIRPAYRRLRIEQHDVFYTVGTNELLIVRVLHEDMDAPRRLLD